jgi:hypothetical protein
VTPFETNPLCPTTLLQILAVHGNILEDRFLGPVAVYLVREYRVLAYSQFLEAYKRYSVCCLNNHPGTQNFVFGNLWGLYCLRCCRWHR